MQKVGRSSTLCPLQFPRSHADIVERSETLRWLFRDAMFKQLLAESVPYAKLIEDS